MLGARVAAWSAAGAAVRWIATITSRAAAVGPDHRPARKFGGFGAGSILGWPTGPMFGEQWIWIGGRCIAWNVGGAEIASLYLCCMGL